MGSHSSLDGVSGGTFPSAVRMDHSQTVCDEKTLRMESRMRPKAQVRFGESGRQTAPCGVGPGLFYIRGIDLNLFPE